MEEIVGRGTRRRFVGRHPVETAFCNSS